MLETYKIKAFEPNANILQEQPWLMRREWGYIMTTKARSEAEKVMADEKGYVGHIYTISKKEYKGIHELVRPDNLLRKRDEHRRNTGCTYHRINNKKDKALRTYACKIENIQGVLTFRMFVFYARVAIGDDNLDFKELVRICFQGAETWIEHDDETISKVENIGFLLNPKLNPKTNFYSQISRVAQQFDENVAEAIRSTYPRSEGAAWACWENKNNYEFFSLRQFVLWFVYQRRKSFLDKNLPEDIKESLGTLDTTIEDILLQADKSKEDFAIDPLDDAIARAEDIGYRLFAVEDFNDFLRIFKIRNTRYTDTLMVEDVTYIKEGKAYKFEKNYFDGSWSSSYKYIYSGGYRSGGGFNDSKDALFHSYSSLYTALYADGTLTTTVENQECMDKIQTAIRSKFKYGEYIGFCHCPIMQGIVSEQSLAAEQALKLGFYRLFSDKNTYRKISTRNHGYTEFQEFKNRNLADMLGKGKRGSRILKKVPRDISDAKFKILSHILLDQPERIRIWIDEQNRTDFFRLLAAYTDILLRIICETEYNLYVIEILSDIHCCFMAEGKSDEQFMKWVQALFRYSDGMSKTIDHSLRLYRDYLRLRERAIEYAREHELNETFPLILKPSRILWMHDHAADYQRRYDRELSMIAESEMRNKFVEAVKEKEYKNLAKDDGEKYEIVIPADADDLLREGEELHHCVAGYWKMVANRSTKIIFLRTKKAPTTPFFTGEIRNNALIQFFGYRNTCNRDSDISSFVKAWAKERNIAIKCAV